MSLLEGALFFLLLLISLSAHAESELRLSPVQVLGMQPKRLAEQGEFAGESIEINSKKNSSLTQQLQKQSGLTPRLAGGEGGSQAFLIRGLDPIQNRYFVDGITLTGAEYNQAYLSFLPVEMVSRVDIYSEGPPIFLAEDGLGGAINFHLKTPSRKSGADVGTRFGSFTYSKVVASFSPSFQIPTRLGFELVRSDEDFLYFDDGGTPFNSSDDSVKRREHNQFERVSLMPQITLVDSDKTNIRLLNITSFNQTSVPGAIQTPTQGTLVQNQTVTAAVANFQFGEWEAESQASFRLSDETLRGRVVSGTLPNEASALSGGVKGVVRWTEDFRWEGVSGLFYDRFDAKAMGDNSGRKERWQLPVGTALALNLDEKKSWSLRPAILSHFYHYESPGVSSLQRSLYGDSPPKNYFLVSPRMGLVGKLGSGWQIRSSVGKFYRAPSLVEIYGSPSGITPNPSLTYETAEKGDVGVDWMTFSSESGIRSVKASVTYFVSRAHDLIAYTQNSQMSRLAINVGEGMIHGQELSTEIKTRFDLNLNVAGTLLWTENLSEIVYERGRELPNRPPYRVTAGLSWEKPKWTVGYDVTWNGPTFWDLANAKKMDSVWQHSLFAFWDLGDFGTLRVEGRNIFDATTAAATYGEWQSTDNNTGYLGYPAPGRRVYVSWMLEV